jgi:hypothetical protein
LHPLQISFLSKYSLGQKKTFEVKPSKQENEAQVEELKMSAMMVTARVEAKSALQDERTILQQSVTATQFAAVDQKLKESLNQVAGYEEGSDGKLKKDFLVDELQTELAYKGILSVESVRDTLSEKKRRSYGNERKRSYF